MVSLGNLTLRKRISLLVLAGLVVGLGLFSWVGLQSSKESTERILDERLTIARVLASHLDETLAYIQLQLDWHTPEPSGYLKPAHLGELDVYYNEVRFVPYESPFCNIKGRRA